MAEHRSSHEGGHPDGENLRTDTALSVRQSQGSTQHATDHRHHDHDGQHHDHHVHVRHGASETHSDQLFKGLVGRKGRSVFSGCVEVCEGAQGCSADQLSRGLLLGEGAEFDARPQLLISYDAVEASHGSSCGAMDEDALFFLRSRGLSQSDARLLMAQAFAGEVHELVATSDWVERSQAALAQRLEGLDG